MKKKMMLAVAAVMMLAACTGSKTTHLSGEFGDNAPDRVKVSVGEDFDKTVEVNDDKFEVDVPKNLASLSRVRAGMSVYSFVSDGSKITLNPIIVATGSVPLLPPIPGIDGDNVLGVIALSEYGSDDPKVILPLIKTLSSKMQQHPDVVKLKKAYEAK